MKAASAGVDEADDDQQRDRDDERVRGRGEQRARLAHAAQVGREQEGDERDSEGYDRRLQRGTADVTAARPDETETATVST